VGGELGRQRRGSPFLKGASGEVAEGVRWGSGSATDAWRKRGTSRGGPCRSADGTRPPVAQYRWARVTCEVRARPAEQRGRGEADRWAAGTVPGSGSDRQAGPAWRREREGGERGVGRVWASP
jgi:hypothetical protein